MEAMSAGMRNEVEGMCLLSAKSGQECPPKTQTHLIVVSSLLLRLDLLMLIIRHLMVLSRMVRHLNCTRFLCSSFVCGCCQDGQSPSRCSVSLEMGYV